MSLVGTAKSLKVDVKVRNSLQITHFKTLNLERSWACVGNCGDVRILGNKLIRRGGDDICGCVEQ
jgi:hypothetical protein